MADKNSRTKSNILNATISILGEEEDISTITIRRIAQRAGVGLGSINYHFRSKENLLNQAVLSLMGDTAAIWIESSKDMQKYPVERLKILFKEILKIALQYPDLFKVSIKYDLLQGNMNTSKIIAPVFKKVFGNKKDDKEINLIAFQAITTMQVMLLRADDFKSFSGIDIYDENERDKYIDLLIENITQ
ncbi:MAG: TetR/AcrR family transcriptional regulator [Actinomycetia bacterium]|nr:TetR/AcrR family transcriptional regulator [Actinomycetes bacterium]